jgi:hypothetical protein
MADDFFILLLSGEDAHHIEKEYKGARRLPWAYRPFIFNVTDFKVVKKSSTSRNYGKFFSTLCHAYVTEAI